MKKNHKASTTRVRPTMEQREVRLKEQLKKIEVRKQINVLKASLKPTK